MINILIVDDSPTDTAILKYLLESDDEFQVVGCAKNGSEAIEMVKMYKPDLVTMDLQMPVVDGFEAIRRIMTENPVPIVVISSVINDMNLNASFLALEAGALYVMEKPQNITSDHFNKSKRFILDTIRSMASIKVFRRNRFAPRQHQSIPITKHLSFNKHFQILAIGASVGGPQALKTILSALPADFPLPIVIVQHMAVGFIDGFIQWLDAKTKLRVKAAEHREPLLRGVVYVAPEHFHLQVTRRYDTLAANLTTGEPVSGFKPSITSMMNSIASATDGNAIGVLLTGMGSDGAQGLLDLKNVHGHTIVQGPETSIVFGMGNVAKTLGAVDKVIELDLIPDYLIHICKNL